MIECTYLRRLKLMTAIREHANSLDIYISSHCIIGVTDGDLSIIDAKIKELISYRNIIKKGE